MKKLSLVTVALLAGATVLSADTLADAFKNGKVDGYIRGGYQEHKIEGGATYTDIALGGKLHYETGAINGVSAGASFYTTQSIDKKENGGVPFFSSKGEGYAILGEAYLQAVLGDTTLKIGRQEIDTPFADADDIGMIQNTFEAGVLINKSLLNTTFILAQVQKMSGVDADTPQTFTKINGDDGVQTIGAIYEGIANLSLAGWYYNLKDFAIENITYIEAGYELEAGVAKIGLGAQYAQQSYLADQDAKIFGLSGSVGVEHTGLTFSAAYNKSSDNVASNGFGGGPFFTSAEHLTLAEAGAEGKATLLGLEWDAGIAGLDGVSVAYHQLQLKDIAGTKADESDLTLSYALDDAISLDVIYSDIDDKISNEAYKNTRVFANYKF